MNTVSQGLALRARSRLLREGRRASFAAVLAAMGDVQHEAARRRELIRRRMCSARIVWLATDAGWSR